jgi:hypothetical protein
MSYALRARALACALAALPRPAAGELAGSFPRPCGAPAVALHAVQGAGAASALRGREVEVEAVVVAAFPGFPEGLGGFFLQEEDADADADPATSEGVFVFDPEPAEPPAAGERVRVLGEVAEFFGQTELVALAQPRICGLDALPAPARLELPAELAGFERVEGMRVGIETRLVATGHADLGRFGEVELAAGGRLAAPTDRVPPGPEAAALAASNARRRLLLDDASRARDPRPVPYLGDGGTLRLGDALAGLEGVLGFAFGRHRIHPTRPVRFERVEPRPEAPPAIGNAGLRVAALNVHGYFDGDGAGGGFPTARGAASPEELALQRAKLAELLARLDADLLALVELENDGAGAGSALADLAAAVASRTGRVLAAVDPGGGLGSHPIAVGLLYRPEVLAPSGPPAVLDARAHPGFDDARNRPSLAQSFVFPATGERFTAVVNHWKSKGSPCDAAGDPDRGDGQGACSGTRSAAARALVEWLARDPTASAGAGVLVLGDLNAYAEEDPLRILASAGYLDLLRWFGGEREHTYVFDGEAGRLDHALASPALLARATGAGVWHANADEPSVLDYRSANPPEVQEPDPFRASDHDPILVGLFAPPEPAPAPGCEPGRRPGQVRRAEVARGAGAKRLLPGRLGPRQDRALHGADRGADGDRRELEALGSAAAPAHAREQREHERAAERRDGEERGEALEAPAQRAEERGAEEGPDRERHCAREVVEREDARPLRGIEALEEGEERR